MAYKSPEPTAVGAVSSAVAVHVASRRWLSFFSLGRAKHLSAMGLISWINKNGFGEILADYGQLPSDQHGWRVAVSLRRIKDQAPFLLFQWEQGDSNRAWTSLACTPDVLNKLETILQETRQRTTSAQSPSADAPHG